MQAASLNKDHVLSLVAKSPSVAKYHTKFAAKGNGSLCCGGCQPCSMGGLCSVTRNIVLRLNDGSADDVEHWEAKSIYGDVYDSTTPSTVTYTLTSEVLNNITYTVLAPSGATTLAQLDAHLGFATAPPAINDTVAFAGFTGIAPSPATTYNTIFSIQSLPSSSSAAYLLVAYNPFLYDDIHKGLLQGDFLTIEFGDSAGSYVISTVNTDGTWGLTELPFGSLVLVKSITTQKPAAASVCYNVIGPTKTRDNSLNDSINERARANSGRHHHRSSSSGSGDC